MGKNNNFIEINGKRYDSHSGKLLLNLDKKPKPDARTAKHTPAAKTKPAAVASAAQTRQTAKHIPAHKPAAARTLMRHVVKKPAFTQHIRAYGPTDELARQPLANVVISKPVQSLDPQRLQKAAQVPKSRLVSHFLPVTAPDFVAQSASFTEPSVKAGDNTFTPLLQNISAAKPNTTADLLEKALHQATSHQQKPLKSPKSERAQHRTALAAVIILPLLLLGIVASHNASVIRLQVASARIGFSAKLPDYRPAGFSQGQLNYSPGVVAAHFHSNSDERAYTVIQQRSIWDNLTLRDHFVASADSHYQTIETSGRTIYLYGTQNATWINDGIWYIIQANGSLSNRQLLELATSL